MSLSINSVDKIRVVNSGTTLIEIPEIQTKNFQQLTRLKSGESMVLAGFRQASNNRDKAGIAGFLGVFGGAESAKTDRVDTIVIITPFILSEPVG
jgi:type II secretory pathway component GspD/PulD (secretin)